MPCELRAKRYFITLILIKCFLSQVLQRLQGEAGREAGQERGRREEALGDQREARWLEE